MSAVEEGAVELCVDEQGEELEEPTVYRLRGDSMSSIIVIFTASEISLL